MKFISQTDQNLFNLHKKKTLQEVTVCLVYDDKQRMAIPQVSRRDYYR